MLSTATRKRASTFWWSTSLASFLAILALLAGIFAFILINGLPALFRWQTYLTITSGTGGGLANAITGTLMLVIGGTLLAIVFGVSAGIYAADYAPPFIASSLRLAVDVLAGVPSVVVGYFGYIALVQYLGWGFSYAAGAIALAIIMLPYVTRAADLAVTAVPRALREGGYALGARHGTVLGTVSIPYALPGILTGVLLGIGIGLGETAPLIYTAGWSNYLPTAQVTHSPIGYLTYVVWTFIGEPFTEAHQLAYGAAVLLMVAVLLVNVVARVSLEQLAVRLRGK